MKKEMKIFMFGLGFVVVSDDYEIGYQECGIDCLKVNCGATIRAWGTSNGIGELASRGVLSDTVLDGYATPVAIPSNSMWQILSLSDKAIKTFKKGIDEAIKKVAVA